MSHVVKSPCSFDSEQAIRRAGIMLGGEIVEKNTYEWWSKHVGDYPLPAGFTAADLGKCDFAIHFPNCRYEVGVVQSKTEPGKFEILFDFYGSGGRELLEYMGGTSCDKFRQAYSVHETALQMETAGYLPEIVFDEHTGTYGVSCEIEESINAAY